MDGMVEQIKGVAAAILMVAVAGLILYGCYRMLRSDGEPEAVTGAEVDRARLEAEIDSLRAESLQRRIESDSLREVSKQIAKEYEDKRKEAEEIRRRYDAVRVTVCSMDDESEFEYFREWLSEEDSSWDGYSDSDKPAPDGGNQFHQDRAGRATGDNAGDRGSDSTWGDAGADDGEGDSVAARGVSVVAGGTEGERSVAGRDGESAKGERGYG